MGLRDRDYMRNKPSDDDWRNYERETSEAEYGNLGAKRKAVIKKVVIAFVVFVVLVVVIGILVSSR